MALSIIWFDFGNIGPTPIMIVLQSDGSVVSVNTNTGVSTIFLNAGTIINPSRQTIGISQWGNQYIILVSSQANGYFLWDGSVSYTSGTLAPPVTVTNGGSGYSDNPTITVVGGTGGGATFSTVVSDGVIAGINLTNPGIGYVITDLGNVTLTITDPTGTGATATVDIMPFGVAGTWAEVYTNHVWVGNGATVIFSAPSSVTDFSTANGGGAFTSNDSFLRVGYTQGRQSNGFLYLIADSSVNYISGVVTSGNPPTTTFTNQNADPEIGTPYANTVSVFSRNILFINAFGAHVSYGGAVTKISDALDTVYSSVPDNFGGFIPSACKTILYGKKCWAFLIPVIDFVTGQKINKLFMWDGKKWWSTQQDVNLIYVQHQEINSVLTAYGTDGNKIYPLFVKPAGFTKRWQSKLSAQPGGYNLKKTADRLWGLAQYFSPTNPNVTFNMDNETGSNPFTQTIDLNNNFATWINNAGQTVPWVNSSGVTVDWVTVGVGIVVFPPVAWAQNGFVIGLTVTTSAFDMAFISLMIGPQEAYYQG